MISYGSCEPAGFLYSMADSSPTTTTATRPVATRLKVPHHYHRERTGSGGSGKKSPAIAAKTKHNNKRALVCSRVGGLSTTSMSPQLSSRAYHAPPCASRRQSCTDMSSGNAVPPQLVHDAASVRHEECGPFWSPPSRSSSFGGCAERQGSAASDSGIPDVTFDFGRPCTESVFAKDHFMHTFADSVLPCPSPAPACTDDEDEEYPCSPGIKPAATPMLLVPSPCGSPVLCRKRKSSTFSQRDLDLAFMRHQTNEMFAEGLAISLEGR